MKKAAVAVSAIILVAIAAITGLTLSFSHSAENSSSVFPDTTVINGIDCSGLTCQQAEDKLSEAWNSRHIQVTCNFNVRTADFTDFGYEYDLIDGLKRAKISHPIAAALNHYFHVPFKIKIPMIIAGYDEDFKDRVMKAAFFTAENAVESQDAYVDLSDPAFPIVNEVYGTVPDMDMVFEDITRSIQRGDMQFVYDERKYATVPEITSNDPNLIAYQEFCQKYLTQKITYKLGEETFTVSAEQLAKLMKDDMSGKADKNAVKKYVTNLASTYDNVNSTREFTSFTGKDITVPPGTYGWMIDQEAETEQLISDINSHADVTRDPIFSATGYGEYSQDMGDTYIDVDISEQMVRYYKKGVLIFESPCVTGSRLTGTVTDVGAYYILNKIRNVVLRGRNADDTEYESPVSYWLGVNWAGEGFHDASWRNTFGGNIWTYDGSHGCINMPPWRMPELYEKAEVDIPVAVHY